LTSGHKDLKPNDPIPRKNFYDSKTFAWSIPIGILFAAISTISHAGDSGSLQPEENGGGLWGLLLYFLFAGIVWSWILSFVFNIIEGIYNSVTRRRR
jgi:hypothetical protein